MWIGALFSIFGKTADWMELIQRRSDRLPVLRKERVNLFRGSRGESAEDILKPDTDRDFVCPAGFDKRKDDCEILAAWARLWGRSHKRCYENNVVMGTRSFFEHKSSKTSSHYFHRKSCRVGVWQNFRFLFSNATGLQIFKEA